MASTPWHRDIIRDPGDYVGVHRLHEMTVLFYHGKRGTITRIYPAHTDYVPGHANIVRKIIRGGTAIPERLGL